MSNEKNSSCDRDFAVVNQKARMETPDDWLHEFRATRKNPSPLNIIKMESEMFQNVTEPIKVLYKTSCPIPTRPIREVVFEEAHPRLLCYMENWNGAYSTAVISKPVGTRSRAMQVPRTPLYSGKLPISEAKYADLQVLKTFCSLQAQQFYDDLPHAGRNVDSHESDLDCSSFED